MQIRTSAGLPGDRAWRSAAAFGVVVGLAACAGAPADADTLRIGVLLPYTGSNGAPSHNFERAALMAGAELAEVGLTGHHVELVFGDTHSDLERGEQSALELVDQGVIGMLGAESDELAETLLPELWQRGVVLLTPGVATEAPGIDPGEPWFRIAPSAESMGEGLAKDLLDRQRDEVSILSTADRYNQSFGGALAKRFAQLGGHVRQRLELESDQLSYAEALRGLAGETDLVLCAPPSTAARIVNEMAALGATPRWALPPALRTYEFVLNVAPSALTDALGVAPDVALDPQFVSAYAARWHGDAPLDSSGFYFDAAALMLLGYERAAAETSGPPDAAALGQGIRDVAFASGIVTYWDGLASSAEEIRSGVGRYYRGLTGAVVLLDPAGQRALGTSKLWSVSPGGAIVDLR